jgi:hypothetical protein
MCRGQQETVSTATFDNLGPKNIPVPYIQSTASPWSGVGTFGGRGSSATLLFLLIIVKRAAATTSTAPARTPS